MERGRQTWWLRPDDRSRVADALHRARVRRGSLELDLPEADVVLDEDDPRRVRAITARRGSEPIKRAYNLVEELMVAANEVVAQRFLEANEPTIWLITRSTSHQTIFFPGFAGLRSVMRSLPSPP